MTVWGKLFGKYRKYSNILKFLNGQKISKLIFKFRLISTHVKILGKYLLVTNTVSCGLMMAAGDVIQQRNDYLRKYDVPTGTYVMAASPNAERKFHNSRNSDDYIHDYERTKNMTIVGLLQGPFHHWFYMILDRVIPGKTALSVIKKTCLDQSIASPTCLGIFFIGLGLLEHRNIEEIREEMRLKLYDTWKVYMLIYY